MPSKTVVNRQNSVGNERRTMKGSGTQCAANGSGYPCEEQVPASSERCASSASANTVVFKSALK